MRCDGLEAARNVGEWGVKLGGVPGLAIISFFRLIKVWSCLPVAPRGDPLPSLHSREFGLLASKEVPTCLSSRACFWTPRQLCLSWIIHVMKVCQKVWMKEMERTMNSLWRPGNNGKYSLWIPCSSAISKGKVVLEALSERGGETAPTLVLSAHLLFEARPMYLHALMKRGRNVMVTSLAFHIGQLGFKLWSHRFLAWRILRAVSFNLLTHQLRKTI